MVAKQFETNYSLIINKKTLKLQLIGKHELAFMTTQFIFLINLDEQGKNYKSGTWTCDLRIDVPGLYQLSYLAQH